METQAIFRNLVTNEFMPGFDYVGTKFSFKTLFSKRLYSYKCCPCAFEHEYFEYINESGDIDEELYNRILLNILNGKCPHVDEQQNHCVRETSVYGIHAAAAVGTEEAVQSHLKNFIDVKSSIFKLGVYGVAAIKKRYQVYNLFLQATPELYCDGNLCNGSILLYPKRSPGRINEIKIEKISILEYFIDARDTVMFRKVLMPNIIHKDIERAFYLIIKTESNVMKEELLKYCDTLMDREVMNAFPKFCAETAVMYDDPNLLRFLLSNKCANIRNFSRLEKERLTGACYLLQRSKCKEVLSKTKHCLIPPDEISELDQIKVLTILLAKFFDDLKTEVLCRLQNVPSIKNKCSNSVMSVLEYIINYSIRHRQLDSRVVRAVLDLVADTEIKRSVATEAYSLLTRLLIACNLRGYSIPRREIMEVLLYENPELDSDNAEIVTRSLEIDKKSWEIENVSSVSRLTGKYFVDGLEHSLLGHDNTNNFHLNFLAPLFIESGFPYSKQSLLHSLDLPLHPAEKCYLQSCLETPRTLKLSCRDILRMLFIGRQIHRLVKLTCVPESVGDFLLMKELLCNIPVAV